MLENYIFFKNSSGAIYGVSPRVIEEGFTPEDGHVEATPEEKEAFTKKISEAASLERPKTKEDLQILSLDLKDKGVLSQGIKKITGVDFENLSQKDLKQIEQSRLNKKNAIKEEKKKALEAEKKVRAERRVASEAKREETKKLAAVEAEKPAQELTPLEKREEALRIKVAAAKNLMKEGD